MFVTLYYYNSEVSLFSILHQIQFISFFTVRPPGKNVEIFFCCFLVPGLQEDYKINLAFELWPLASL